MFRALPRSCPGFPLAVGLLLAALPAGAAQFACGDTLGPSKTPITVDNDLLSCRGVGLTIVGPVIVELGSGFVICDPDFGGNAGIVVEGKGAKVRGGRVADCGVALVLRGSDHRVTGFFADDNSTGIAFEDVVRSRVEKSRVEEATTGVSFASRSERNTLADTDVRGIGFIGVKVDGRRNRLDGNEIFDSEQTGFSVIGARHVLVDNRARVDGVAHVVFGTDIDLVGNHAVFSGDGGGGVNDGLGFKVSGARIDLRGNVARRNLGAGFRFERVENVRVEKNRAELNGKGGFVLVDVVGGDFKKNVAFGNFGGPGIQVTATGNRTLRMRQNTSTRHVAPFHDLTDDQLCTHTQWIDNEFDRGSSGCIQ